MALKAIGIAVLCLSIFIAHQLVDHFDPETVNNKNVIITGASTGIGQQLAYHYARLGANILITARREQQLQKVIDKCREIGNKEGKYYYVSLDMMDQEAPLKLVKYVENIFDKIDYVVLNHILSYHIGRWVGTNENFTQLERTFTVNFNSYVSIASHAMHHLELSNGSLIVVSSATAKFPVPYWAPYVASKHALQVCGFNIFSPIFNTDASLVTINISQGIVQQVQCLRKKEICDNLIIPSPPPPCEEPI